MVVKENEIDKIDLDIIIPSFRADMNFLVPLLELESPEKMDTYYYIIIDNPTLKVPDKLLDLAELDDSLTLLANENNLGAAGARNRGLDHSKSEYILFLDDDVLPEPDLLFSYYKILYQHSTENLMGYAGLIEFPPSVNSFTRGVYASDILTFFSVMTWMDKLSWGVTANLLLFRKYVDGKRFSDEFPKLGGGEDIDLCLRMKQSEDDIIVGNTDVSVTHPWWNNGKRQYRRFFRWAYGDSRLPKLHSQHAYRNLPNVAEMALIAILVAILGLYQTNEWHWLLLPPVVWMADVVGEWIKLGTTKGLFSPIIALESELIRASNDLGRLYGNLSRGRIIGITERFDYFCNGLHIGTERLWALVKFILMLIFPLWLLVVV